MYGYNAGQMHHGPQINLESGKRLVTKAGEVLERIGGFETEYAYFDEGDHDPDKPDRAIRVLARVRSQNPQFSGHDGTRQYLDVGRHPEYDTDERINFSEMAHAVLVGHTVMQRIHGNAARQLAAKTANHQNPIDPSRIHLIANTCDYNGASWGSHGSLLTRRAVDFREIIPPMAAHRASRIVWSGVGAVDIGAEDYRFELSEKAPYIYEMAHISTTKERALVNLRDEPLANGFHFRRLHDAAGETVFSAFALGLRQASESIILRAIETGTNFDDLVPEQPVLAMRQISRDPSLKAAVRLEGGRKLTGIQLQREIAERAITAAEKADYITEQEQFWGKRWEVVLDDLEQEPLDCADRVDWIDKQRLIGREIDRRKRPGVTDKQIAITKAINYGRLLPNEGAGMRKVRAAKFIDSPSPEVLEQGLPPAPTRSALRSMVIRELDAEGRDHSDNWNVVRDGKSNLSIWMDNPYENVTGRAKDFIERVRIAPPYSGPPPEPVITDDPDELYLPD